jgi:peptide/nickel transport system permease protein
MTQAIDSNRRLVRLVGRRRRTPGAVVLVAAAVGLVILVCAIAGTQLAPHSPTDQSLIDASQLPSAEHLLGTDVLGRDIFSRLLVGTRTMVVGPVLAALGTVVFAMILGLVAGYSGGRVDALIMRTLDILHALPAILVAVVVVGALGGGYYLAVACIIVLAIPSGARMIRSATMTQRSLPYVEAARTLGLGRPRIMFVHVLPNILPTVAASMIIDFVYAIVSLSSLSFLGLGVPPGAPDWGRTIADNRPLLEINPAAVLAPALAIVILATAFTVIGDYLYDRLGSSRGEFR